MSEDDDEPALELGEALLGEALELPPLEDWSLDELGEDEDGVLEDDDEGELLLGELDIEPVPEDEDDGELLVPAEDEPEGEVAERLEPLLDPVRSQP